LLILEAKREKDAQNFEQMEIQTGFPIKNTLKLQYDLMKTRGNTMDVPGGPLVWFFASRGEGRLASVRSGDQRRRMQTKLCE
jgi:hypothetical protein